MLISPLTQHNYLQDVIPIFELESEGERWHDK